MRPPEERLWAKFALALWDGKTLPSSKHEEHSDVKGLKATMYKTRSLRTVILLAALMCVAGILRFYGLEIQ